MLVHCVALHRNKEKFSVHHVRFPIANTNKSRIFFCETLYCRFSAKHKCENGQLEFGHKNQLLALVFKDCILSRPIAKMQSRLHPGMA